MTEQNDFWCLLFIPHQYGPLEQIRIDFMGVENGVGSYCVPQLWKFSGLPVLSTKLQLSAYTIFLFAKREQNFLMLQILILVKTIAELPITQKMKYYNFMF